MPLSLAQDTAISLHNAYLLGLPSLPQPQLPNMADICPARCVRLTSQGTRTGRLVDREKLGVNKPVRKCRDRSSNLGNEMRYNNNRVQSIYEV